MEEPTSIIVVLGSPVLWFASIAPQKVKKDSGLIYIAQNAARHPDSPLEPLFRALYIEYLSFDIHSTDVVSDRNNIRKFLSFVFGRAGVGNDIESFTIKIEVIKNIVILCRMETATHEFIGPNEFRGFGHEFEKAYTVNQIKGSTGHHRIISYRFGGLNFIIRHETDGYVDDGIIMPSSCSKGKEIDSLSYALGSLSLSIAYSNACLIPVARSKLTVKQEGRVIPLESIIEIKTRVFHKPVSIEDIAPQLWTSQTPNLVRAYHRAGVFQQPQLEDVTAHIKRWEAYNQAHLKKLVALIEKLIIVVKSRGAMVLKYDPLGDKLVLSETEGAKMLPEDLYLKWKDKEQLEAEIDTKASAKTDALQGEQLSVSKEVSNSGKHSRS